MAQTEIRVHCQRKHYFKLRAIDKNVEVKVSRCPICGQPLSLTVRQVLVPCSNH